VLTVSLSPKPEKGAIALAAPWNGLPRKVQVLDPTQQVYAELADRIVLRFENEIEVFVVTLGFGFAVIWKQKIVRLCKQVRCSGKLSVLKLDQKNIVWSPLSILRDQGHGTVV
jgi:hypothetical protein